MKNIWTIIKKELRRFFTDRRMIMSLILPGVMIFVLYSIMGGIMPNIGSSDKDYKFKVVIENIEEQTHVGMTTHFAEFDGVVVYLDAADYPNYKKSLETKEIDLYVVYDKDFYDKAKAYISGESPLEDLPKVEIYNNSANKNSSNASNEFYKALNKFNDEIAQKFTINPGSDQYDMAKPEELVATIISLMVPFLLIMFLFSGAMSISIEAIAGEKERGTIATLLATPVKRSSIALGKIISLSIVSLVSATSSFIGLFLSLPKLMGGADISFNIYGVGTYVLLFLVIVVTTLLFVVLVSLVSAYSKSVKEANSLSSVLLIVNTLIGVLSMTGISTEKVGAYFIPVFNSVQSLTAILSGEFITTNFIVTILVNIVLVVGGIFALSKMFNSEKIMFNK